MEGNVLDFSTFTKTWCFGTYKSLRNIALSSAYVFRAFLFKKKTRALSIIVQVQYNLELQNWINLTLYVMLTSTGSNHKLVVPCFQSKVRFQKWLEARDPFEIDHILARPETN
jgi:hypothetical protein